MVSLAAETLADVRSPSEAHTSAFSTPKVDGRDMPCCCRLSPDAPQQGRHLTVEGLSEKSPSIAPYSFDEYPEPLSSVMNTACMSK